LALHRAIDKISAQQAELQEVRLSTPKTGPLIQTKHEQERALHKHRFITSMGGLDKIAKGLNDTSTAIRHYSNMEIECSSKLYEEMKLVSLESIASESESNSDDNLKLLKTVQARVTGSHT